MSMRRSPFGMILMVGFGVLLGAALFGGSAAVGGLVAAPFMVLGFLFKVALLVMLFGLAASFFAGFGGRRNKGWSRPSRERWSQEARKHWHGQSESPPGEPHRSTDDRFEEWHRMAHARKEVDDHVPPVDD